MKSKDSKGFVFEAIKRNKKYAIFMGCLILFYGYSVFTGWAWFNFVDSEKTAGDGHSSHHSSSHNHK